MVNRHIELTEEQNETLERLAASQGRPVAELIRAGVDVVLSRGASILPFERESGPLRMSDGRRRSSLRESVRSRARGLCEYCRSQERFATLDIVVGKALSPLFKRR
jgi:hypothetical protein